MSVTVGDVLSAVHEAFPPEWAEAWDAVGLLAGDSSAQAGTVLVSLDPTRDALSRAAETGAGVLVTHHPAFLVPADRMVPEAAGVTFDAVRFGVALICAHTNLDRAPAGAGALARTLGLDEGEPLEDAPLPVVMVTAYVPSDHRGVVTRAMAAAGAGRIGEYRECSFSVEGTGRFTPAATSDPFTGTAGQAAAAGEVRVEMVTPPARAAAVVAAARGAHPYEEPLIVVANATIARGSARMGRVSELPTPTTLGEFAAATSVAFGITPRVWGEPGVPVARVATASGSAGSLIASALRARADVLVAGEVRYHDAQAASEAGLGIIEIGHDISEWPLVPVLAEAVRATPGLDPASVLVDSPAAAWWTP